MYEHLFAELNLKGFKTGKQNNILPCEIWNSANVLVNIFKHWKSVEYRTQNYVFRCFKLFQAILFFQCCKTFWWWVFKYWLKSLKLFFSGFNYDRIPYSFHTVQCCISALPFWKAFPQYHPRSSVSKTYKFSAVTLWSIKQPNANITKQTVLILFYLFWFILY